MSREDKKIWLYADDQNDSDKSTFNSSMDSHGMYETMRFVLSLSPRNHELVDSIPFGIQNTKDIPDESLKAYSTYIHETVHWWQHIGSTSGLLLSLSFLGQSHSTMRHLKNVADEFGPKKSLLRWTNEILLAEGSIAQNRLAEANIAVNNALDVEYYKIFAHSPKSHIDKLQSERHFISAEHCYRIVYGQLLGMIASVADEEFQYIPDIRKWTTGFDALYEEKAEGLFWKHSTFVAPIGLHAIYEGQARFIQLQFLDSGRNDKLTCEEWRELGYFEGIYGEAFNTFLEASGRGWPKQFDDPIIGLFLIICDISINPTRGMPLDIENFEGFFDEVDVGLRFIRLCLAAKALPNVERAIKNYSRQEYIEVSRELVDIANLDHPLVALEAIKSWIENSPEFQSLMEEQRTFDYKGINQPVRVFFSHFLAFSIDRLERPEIFCWTGKWMSGDRASEESMAIWLRNLSLFSNRPDKPGVYPRKWPNREHANVMKMFNEFYGSMALYDLTRQWILFDGPFKFNYRWLSDQYSFEELKVWAENVFKAKYNISLDDFLIL